MTNSPLKIDDKAVSEAAYYLWLEEGCPEGKAEEHWHRARAALGEAAPKPAKRRGAAKGTAKAAAKPKAKTAKPKAAATAKPRARKPKTKDG
jgi:hypothetical protein